MKVYLIIYFQTIHYFCTVPLPTEGTLVAAASTTYYFPAFDIVKNSMHISHCRTSNEPVALFHGVS